MRSLTYLWCHESSPPAIALQQEISIATKEGCWPYRTDSPLQVHGEDHYLSCLYRCQLLQRLRVHMQLMRRGRVWQCVILGVSALCMQYVSPWQRISALPRWQSRYRLGLIRGNRMPTLTNHEPTSECIHTEEKRAISGLNTNNTYWLKVIPRSLQRCINCNFCNDLFVCLFACLLACLLKKVVNPTLTHYHH